MIDCAQGKPIQSLFNQEILMKMYPTASSLIEAQVLPRHVSRLLSACSVFKPHPYGTRVNQPYGCDPKLFNDSLRPSGATVDPSTPETLILCVSHPGPASRLGPVPS